MVTSLPPAELLANSTPATSVPRTGLIGADGLKLSAGTFPAAIPLQPQTRLLYAHGFGQTRNAWQRTGSALAAKGYSGLAYDARGHGESQRNAPDQPYSGDQFADDLIIVAGECSPAPVLVGASMGGLFGLIAEARWPGLFSAMVLVDITPRWESAGMQRILGFMTAFPEGFDSLQHASDAIAAYLPHRRTRKSPEELRELLREGDDGRWRWHWDPRLVDELARDSEQHQDAIAEAARGIRCPILLISGGRSDLVSEQTVEEFRTLAPHARHVHLPQATHMVAGDDNDAFTATVLEYLADLRTTSATIESGFTEPAATESVPGASP
ncbi:alpha/beta fold hydrolase [Pseudoxanthomonas wuyuanensis]|nr:alpha/beta hydrolase [Pseudoxanthomonas wuyuanensis]KAF1717228.1 alpha/beta hydrolase [Pseudoxanthomonas wuyuanensis]